MAAERVCNAVSPVWFERVEDVQLCAFMAVFCMPCQPYTRSFTIPSLASCTCSALTLDTTHGRTDGRREAHFGRCTVRRSVLTAADPQATVGRERLSRGPFRISNLINITW